MTIAETPKPTTPAVAASNVLALPADDPWRDVDDGFIGATAPEVAPTLPLLDFNANMGFGFTDEATGQIYGVGDTVRVVWLAWSESRAWWELEFGKGDKTPTCRSADMLRPDPSSPKPQAEKCAECPRSKWTDDGAPDCGVRVNVMVYLLDEQRITRTAFRGIALRHVAQYIGGFKARLGGRPPMAYVTEITVAEQETDYGPKLVPHFRVAEAIDHAEAAPLIALRDEFLAQWKSLLAEDLAQATQQEGGGPSIDPFGGEGTTVDTTSSSAGDGRIHYDGDEEPF